MGTAQVLRELFKRPSFLPKEGEISLEKTVMVSNTKSEKHAWVKYVILLFIKYQTSKPM